MHEKFMVDQNIMSRNYESLLARREGAFPNRDALLLSSSSNQSDLMRRPWV